jgi:hypothetical protein
MFIQFFFGDLNIYDFLIVFGYFKKTFELIFIEISLIAD